MILWNISFSTLKFLNVLEDDRNKFILFLSIPLTIFGGFNIKLLLRLIPIYSKKATDDSRIVFKSILLLGQPWNPQWLLYGLLLLVKINFNVAIRPHSICRNDIRGENFLPFLFDATLWPIWWWSSCRCSSFEVVVHYNITYVQFEGDKKINDWGSSTLSPLTQWNSSASSSYLLFLWI